MLICSRLALGGEAVDVAGEQGGLFDVIEADGFFD